MPILNFYVVKNQAIKDEQTSGFKRYCKLRDDANKAFYIYQGCKRRWMNQDSEERGNSGINVLWPKQENQLFKEALEAANKGQSPNNISPIITYSTSGGITFQWMGDLETKFMENIQGDVKLSKVSVLFAPHHGRKTGKVPKTMLDILQPDIIVIGEASSDELNYYQGYNTITQNTAGDITFINDGQLIHIYVSNTNYHVDFLYNLGKDKTKDGKYLGSHDASNLPLKRVGNF